MITTAGALCGSLLAGVLSARVLSVLFVGTVLAVFLLRRLRATWVRMSLIGLMCSGFIEMLLNATDASLALPGAAVLPLKALIHLQTSSLGLILASAGVIVLCLLPAVRVILALWLYLRLRDLLNTLIAVTVFLELLVSIHIST